MDAITGLIGGALTLTGMIVGGLVWLIRLEGKINTQDALRLALENRLARFEQRIYSTLERIENKLDDKVDRP